MTWFNEDRMFGAMLFTIIGGPFLGVFAGLIAWAVGAGNTSLYIGLGIGATPFVIMIAGTLGVLFVVSVMMMITGKDPWA